MAPLSEPTPCADQAHDSLILTLEAFLLATTRNEQAELRQTIAKVAGGMVDPVLAALTDVRVWSPQRTGDTTFEWSENEGNDLTVHLRLPPGYDAKQAYGLALCIGAQGASASATFDDTDRWVRGLFFHPTPILAFAGESLRVSYHESPHGHRDIIRLLREIRTRVHIDSDRILLLGLEEQSANYAWLRALHHPDLFAGAVLENGFPNVPYPDQLDPLLLSNVRCRIISLFGSGRYFVDHEHLSNSVVAHNRRILDLARERSLPILGLEPGNGASPKAPAGEDRKIDLDLKRLPTATSISHWFRFLEQGTSGWLHVTQLQGEPWTDEQISILPAATSDRDAFITDVLKSKLAWIGGEIRTPEGDAGGQGLHIQTRRVARLEIRLTRDLIDFDKPVRITCNGVIRFEGRLAPSVDTLLDSILETWDFQRPYVCRVPLVIKSNVSDQR